MSVLPATSRAVPPTIPGGRTRLAGAEVVVGWQGPATAPLIARNEIPRKLLHIGPGLLAFALPLIPHPRPLSAQSMLEITAITVVLTGVYIAFRRRVERRDESDFWVTTLSYPAIILASLFAFRDAPEVTSVVLVALALGDGAAFLGGKLIGGPRLPWNARKSWAGTLSFAAVAGPLAVLAYHLEAGPGTWLAAALCGGAAATVAALAESLPTRLSDNLRVGLAASVTAGLMHYAAVPFLVSA